MAPPTKPAANTSTSTRIEHAMATHHCRVLNEKSCAIAGGPQGTIIVVCPGAVIWMTPPQAHISFDDPFSVGMLPTSIVGEPGAHGAGVTGTHGIGVKAPSAAAVAAATTGLDIELHVPNGGTFTMGTLSMIVAAGVPVSTALTGRTASVLGAVPKLHCITAPMQT